MPDRITGQGPLGGIDAALRHAQTEFTFITDATSPFFHLPFSVSLPRGHMDATSSSHAAQRTGTSCAIYGKGCLPFVEEGLTVGRRNVFHLIDRVHALIVPTVEIATVTRNSSRFSTSIRRQL